ncbi:MAG: Hpt domain-containing protein [Rhodospirillales bacterium]|nr:Hpt domain-containing protein [Rhodospirillales bacterium]
MTKIDDVGAAAGAVRTDPLSGPGLEALGALKQLVYKLAGSGGTFGFWEISDAAEKAETACEAVLETPSMDRWRSIEGHLEELLNAVNGAFDGG